MSRPELLHMTDNVYLFPGDMRLARPWVGAVLTGEGTVLIDSGTGPAHAAEIQAALDEAGAAPVRHILLTHHHWDHLWGISAFPDAHIVAHTLTQRHLETMAGEPWSDEYVEAKGSTFPRGQIVAEFMKRSVPDWSTFRLRPADSTFDERYEMELGGSQFRMEHVGGAHEPDQCIVHVEPGNVLFLGDATYGRGAKAQWDRALLGAALQGFLARGAAWYAEGHRAPATAARFAARVARFLEEEKAG